MNTKRFSILLSASLIFLLSSCTPNEMNSDTRLRLKVVDLLSGQDIKGVYCEVFESGKGFGTGDLQVGGNAEVIAKGQTDSLGIFEVEFNGARRKSYSVIAYNSLTEGTTQNGISSCRDYDIEEFEWGTSNDMAISKIRTCTMSLVFEADPNLPAPDSLRFSMPRFLELGCTPFFTEFLFGKDDVFPNDKPSMIWPAGDVLYRWEVLRNAEWKVFEMEDKLEAGSNNTLKLTF